MGWIILGVYLLCGAAAFALFVDSWRRKWDVERRDAVVFGFLSLGGPASLLTAILVWLVEREWDASPVVWRRK